MRGPTSGAQGRRKAQVQAAERTCARALGLSSQSGVTPGVSCQGPLRMCPGPAGQRQRGNARGLESAPHALGFPYALVLVGQ